MPRRPKRAAIKAWTGLGPVRSLRGGLLLVTALAVTPLVVFGSGLAVMRAADSNQMVTAAMWATASAVPVLIGVAAVMIVGVAFEAMIMQWLSYLERLSRAYARGRYSLRPLRLKNAPLEFRTLGAAVEDMAAAVEHRDQALHEALDEQTVLLREVHHRVKNNLQIVGSLLSLQASRLDDAPAREALQDALVRIDAMSLSQRFMQQQEEDVTVQAGELFEAFATQMRARLGPGRRRMSLTTDIAPIALPLETGSRLALIAAEAILCAFRARADGSLLCNLTLGPDPDGVRMTLVTPNDPTAFHVAPGRVCHDLIGGYVRQAHGRLICEPGCGLLAIVAPLPGGPGA